MSGSDFPVLENDFPVIGNGFPRLKNDSFNVTNCGKRLKNRVFDSKSGWFDPCSRFQASVISGRELAGRSRRQVFEG
jgi:hypothetical protein